MSTDQKLVRQAKILATQLKKPFLDVYRTLKGQAASGGGGADRRQPVVPKKPEPAGPVEYKATPYYAEVLSRQRTQNITYVKASLQVRKECPQLFEDMLDAVNR